MATANVTIERPRVLIADDQPHVGEALRLALRDEGFQIELAGSPAAVVHAIGARRFDLALLDLNYARDTTSGAEGLELIKQVRIIDGDLPIVVMTAWGSIEVAVEAMQRGAGDFIQKPWDNSVLRRILRTQLDRGRVRREVRQRELRDERERTEARETQLGLLPRDLPNLPGFELVAVCRPARTLCGDYYDVLTLDASHALICIGDVSGKGAAAALVMSNLQAAVKAYAGENCTPVELCRRVNRILRGNCEPGRYVTFFAGMLDTDRSTLSYVNAGHNPPLVARRNGSVLKLSRWRSCAGRIRGLVRGAGRNRDRVAATEWCCIQMASPRPQTQKATNLAPSGSPICSRVSAPVRLATFTRGCSPQPCASPPILSLMTPRSSS